LVSLSSRLAAATGGATVVVEFGWYWLIWGGSAGGVCALGPPERARRRPGLLTLPNPRSTGK
jgi:hypothetical protein